MKNLKLIGFLMLLASSLMFIQCTTDTLQGLDGTNGINGVDGAAGADGIAGVAGAAGVDGADIGVCVSCHSNTHRDQIVAEYTTSNHNFDLDAEEVSDIPRSWARGSSSSCAQCHSNQGFIEYQETGQVVTGFTNSDPLSCTGCHNAHRSFDFVNDGNDYALRTIEPVQLLYTATEYLFDSKNESDPLGASNTCVNCHQPRSSQPTVTTYPGKYLQTSTHWGPHHGPQSTLLDGIQGFEFSADGISADGSAAHKTKMSCVACHMETVDEGHSWEPADYASSTCVKCHDAKPEVAGFETGMADLAVKLENVVGWEYKYSVLRDVDGAIIYAADRDGNLTVLQFLDADDVVTDDSDLYVIEEDVDGAKIKVDVIGAVHDGHPNTGFYGEGATFSIEAAGAAWNYLFLLEDKSNGVHNPVYAKKLIELSNQQF
jgi:nitrate reductase cytochrome c-type subunit